MSPRLLRQRLGPQVPCVTVAPLVIVQVLGAGGTFDELADGEALKPSVPVGLTEPDRPPEPEGLTEPDGPLEPEGLTKPDDGENPDGRPETEGRTEPEGLTLDAPLPDGLTEPLTLVP